MFMYGCLYIKDISLFVNFIRHTPRGLFVISYRPHIKRIQRLILSKMCNFLFRYGYGYSYSC